MQGEVYTWVKIRCKSGGLVGQFWMQFNILGDLNKDYRAMKTMIFGETPDFTDILASLRQLETAINGQV